MNSVRRVEATVGWKKLLRKARRDAWDDAADKALELGLLDRAGRQALHDANPHREPW